MEISFLQGTEYLIAGDIGIANIGTTISQTGKPRQVHGDSNTMISQTILCLPWQNWVIGGNLGDR